MKAIGQFFTDEAIRIERDSREIWAAKTLRESLRIWWRQTKEGFRR